MSAKPDLGNVFRPWDFGKLGITLDISVAQLVVPRPSISVVVSSNLIHVRKPVECIKDLTNTKMLINTNTMTTIVNFILNLWRIIPFRLGDHFSDNYLSLLLLIDHSYYTNNFLFFFNIILNYRLLLFSITLSTL